MKKTVFVTAGFDESGRKYRAGVDRLVESLEKQRVNKSDYLFLAIKGLANDTSILNCEPHKTNPYAFKIAAIDRAIDVFKADQVIWVDSSMVAVKNPAPVINRLSEIGVFMEESGHYVSDWCNNFTLNYFGITRAQASEMTMFSAGFTGIDFTTEIGCKFFNRWKESMQAGCFKGDWSNHRHDMSAGSIIANQMGLRQHYSTGGTFLAYVGPGYAKPKESAVFHLIGL